MGRHSGASELSGAMQNERIGARRAALMAERSSKVVEPQADSPSVVSPSLEAVAPVVRNDGSAFAASSLTTVPVPATTNVVTIEIPYARPHVSAVKNSRVAAAMIVAAASMFGAATAVSADSPDSHTANTKAKGAASLASLTVPSLETVSAAATDEVSFTVKVDGASQDITTDQPTLGDALREAGVVLGADDKVSASLSERVENGSVVTIVRVSTTTISEDAVDAHETSEIEDPELARGERVVETEGVDGLSVNTYEVTLEDDVETSRVQAMEVIKTARVDEVVRVGTKEAAGEASTAGSTDQAATTSESFSGSAQSVSVGRAVPSGEAQNIALSMMASYGWGDDQFSCLVPLWQRESGWRSDAANPSSSARGIPQAMMSVHFGANWQSNPAAIEWMNSPSQQISWGLNYIAGRYGNPCGAWAHSQATGWY